MADCSQLGTALLGKHILLASFSKLHYTGIIAKTIGSNIFLRLGRANMLCIHPTAGDAYLSRKTEIQVHTFLDGIT